LIERNERMREREREREGGREREGERERERERGRERDQASRSLRLGKEEGILGTDLTRLGMTPVLVLLAVLAPV
jgi:hypothetical protein